MARLRTFGISAVIAAFLALIAVDGLPSLGLFHDRARRFVEPFLRATGLFQGSWTVFAPRVDRENHHLEVHIDYDTGDSRVWRSPVWSELSALDKLTRFREMEYTEQLFGNSTRPLRAAFAHYLARELRPTDGAKPKKIAVTHHYSVTEPPAEGEEQPLPPPNEHPNVISLYVEQTP